MLIRSKWSPSKIKLAQAVAEHVILFLRISTLYAVTSIDTAKYQIQTANGPSKTKKKNNFHP